MAHLGTASSIVCSWVPRLSQIHFSITTRHDGLPPTVKANREANGFSYRPSDIFDASLCCVFTRRQISTSRGYGYAFRPDCCSYARHIRQDAPVLGRRRCSISYILTGPKNRLVPSSRDRFSAFSFWSRSLSSSSSFLFLWAAPASCLSFTPF